MVHCNLDPVTRYMSGGIALPKILTEAEYDLAISSVKLVRKRSCFFWENVMHMASYGGFRESELCRVKLDHIDWLEKTILVPLQKNKNNNEKVVVPDFLLNRLREHIKLYEWQIRKHDNYIFFSPGHSRGHIAPQSIRLFISNLRIASGLVRSYSKRKPIYRIQNCSNKDIIYEISKKVYNKKLQIWRKKVYTKRIIPAGKSIRTTFLKDELLNQENKPNNIFKVQISRDEKPLYVFSFHTLRHLFATRMVEHGVTADEIKQAGRWISILSVERYKHTSLLTKRNAVNKTFNEKEIKSEQDMRILKDEIMELKNIIKASLIFPHQQSNSIDIQNANSPPNDSMKSKQSIDESNSHSSIEV